MKVHVKNEQLWKLQKYLVGKVVTFCETRSLTDRMERMELGEIRVKRIRGNHFFIKIPDDNLVETLKQKEWVYLKKFFISREPWFEMSVLLKKVSWIKISRVPLYCWNYEMFKRVASY